MNPKKQRRKSIEAKILVAIAALILLLNYGFLDEKVKDFLNTNKEVHAERVIDGDTFRTGAGNVRLLGINTPEKGDFFHEEAKDFLESRIKGKNVTLEFLGERYDKYGRILAYVFLDGKNLNSELVENGFANYYLYSGKDRHSDELLDSWNKCMEKSVGLCEKSGNICSSCIKISGISGSSIINSCGFSCNITDWSVRGEGREKFIFSDQALQPGEKTAFALDLSNTGGSVFVRDEKGKLVEWRKG